MSNAQDQAVSGQAAGSDELARLVQRQRMLRQLQRRFPVSRRPAKDVHGLRRRYLGAAATAVQPHSGLPT